MVIIGINSVHKPFNQAGMREAENPLWSFIIIGLDFSRVRTQKTRLNTGLQELWYEIYYNSNRESCYEKRIKYKMKPQNTKITYENTAIPKELWEQTVRTTFSRYCLFKIRRSSF